MYEFLIKGIVQGVGFRPYIYNACSKAQMKGYVQNIGSGVIVVVNKKEEFTKLLSNIPPLSRIDWIGCKKTTGTYKGFSIKESIGQGYAEVPADLFMCQDCLEELRDETNRRHQYWFISCTNCGPRYSMITSTPYDRPYTAMKHFEMCKACKEEYTDPTNRRYHAQTIACPDCGPELIFKDKEGNELGGLKEAAGKIMQGEIVAIKGVGGYHLVCTAEAVTLLRTKTRREHKPFALMVKDKSMAEEIVHCNEAEYALLESKTRPIVIMNKKNSLSFSEVSELGSLGIMLPYTGLHHLLFDYFDEPLVFTSSNMPGEPITTEENEQFVDYILSHNRDIIHAVDDSLAKIIDGQTLWLRRSRGLVPQSIAVNNKEEILALGAEMNSSFCIIKKGKAILSQYFGTLSNIDVEERYKEELKKLLALYDCTPKKIICDEHTDYTSTRIAHQLAQEKNIPVQHVQHHQAHLAAVAAEHNITDYIGISCDGIGYGSDGNMWGGEIFDNNKRIGHLQEQVLLGGDTATKKPAVMLYSMLLSFLSAKEAQKIMGKKLSEQECTIYEKEYDKKLSSPLTTSCGRVLDAAAALLDLCDERSYEGRPAMMLEFIAANNEPYILKPLIQEKKGLKVLNSSELFAFLINNLDKDKGRLAATVFHYLAYGLYKIAYNQSPEKNIIFGGGVSYNTQMTTYFLKKGALIAKNIPAGDGGIAFGQATHSTS